ncbi:hypothetical protein PAL_GLEAN10002945 [Pteropus alecto]|uniref:Uncharacterized protein n=1 Tax=Pteropus alecto TaxID=9402 RepID=L5JVV1_PTEAL|nr:hypothetical protein PAL_GLEAN10002945 [Pteropus alecto]
MQRKRMRTPHEAPPAALQRLSPTPALPGPRRPLPRPPLVSKPFTTRQASVSPRGVLGARGLDWGPGRAQPHGTPGPPCESDLDVTVQAPCSPNPHLPPCQSLCGARRCQSQQQDRKASAGLICAPPPHFPGAACTQAGQTPRVIGHSQTFLGR